MFTYKFLGLDEADSRTPYYYGSLPAKPEIGHILVFDGTNNRYRVTAINGEGLVGDGPDEQQELAWADIGADKPVPTLLLQKLATTETPPPGTPETKPQGRSFDYEEVKAYSQENRRTRLASTH